MPLLGRVQRSIRSKLSSECFLADSVCFRLQIQDRATARRNSFASHPRAYGVVSVSGGSPRRALEVDSFAVAMTVSASIISRITNGAGVQACLSSLCSRCRPLLIWSKYFPDSSRQSQSGSRPYHRRRRLSFDLVSCLLRWYICYIRTRALLHRSSLTHRGVGSNTGKHCFANPARGRIRFVRVRFTATGMPNDARQAVCGARRMLIRQQ